MSQSVKSIESLSALRSLINISPGSKHLGPYHDRVGAGGHAVVTW
jgi:hypothetical protein